MIGPGFDSPRLHCSLLKLTSVSFWLIIVSMSNPMTQMTPKQANDLRTRARNAEKRLVAVRKERDYLRAFIVELRDDSDTNEGLKKRIQRALNKAFA